MPRRLRVAALVTAVVAAVVAALLAGLPGRSDRLRDGSGPCAPHGSESDSPPPRTTGSAQPATAVSSGPAPGSGLVATADLRSAEPPTSVPSTTADGARLVFYDGFDGPGLDCSRWTVYRGQPKSSNLGYWTPSQVTVAQGMLTLRTSYDAALRRYVSGGVSTVHARGGVQQYGTWLMRFRVDAGDGVGDVALLYPAGGGWPPEIDITESAGGDRSESLATLHYGPENSEIHRMARANFDQWHTIGVDWSADQLTYTLDGRPYASVRSSGIPRQPMWMGIQTQASPCHPDYPTSCRSASTPPIVAMDVDWVAIYH